MLPEALRLTLLILISVLIGIGPVQAQERSGCISLTPDTASVTQPLEGVGCGSPTLSVAEVVSKFSIKGCAASEEARVLRCSTRLLINNLQDVNIDGAGWKIIFSDPRGGNGGVYFIQAKNV